MQVINYHFENLFCLLKHRYCIIGQLIQLAVMAYIIDTIFTSFRFFFSIREHTNIVLCSMDHERRVSLLLDTMKLCSDKIFLTFCEILGLVEMDHVIRKLERKRQSLGKRKSTPGKYSR